MGQWGVRCVEGTSNLSIIYYRLVTETDTVIITAFRLLLFLPDNLL